MVRTALLIIQPGGLAFGCLKARDLRGADAVVEVYDTPSRSYVLRVPFSGDVILCRHLHSSVFRPIAIVRIDSLILRRLDIIPPDVATAYFPLFDYIACP